MVSSVAEVSGMKMHKPKPVQISTPTLPQGYPPLPSSAFANIHAVTQARIGVGGRKEVGVGAGRTGRGGVQMVTLRVREKGAQSKV